MRQASLKPEMPRCTCGSCGAPKFICYAGKRQWMELLNTGKRGKEKISKIDQGRQVLRPQVHLGHRTVYFWFGLLLLELATCLLSLG